MAASALSADFAKRSPAIPIIRLSHIEATAPEAIVEALSHELEEHIQALLPPDEDA